MGFDQNSGRNLRKLIIAFYDEKKYLKVEVQTSYKNREL